MGQVSDPYDQGEDDVDLSISALPEEPDQPEDVVTSGPDEPLGDFDDAHDAVDDPDDDDEFDAVDDLDADDRGVEGAGGDEEAPPGADDDGDDGDDDGEEVAYNLDDFDDDQLEALFDALDDEAIPYLWDGEELFVQADDEQAVDVLLERIADPQALTVQDDDTDGGGWLLGELFVVADRLQHDPEEHESVALLLQLANAADEADPPYGLAEPEWEQLHGKVTNLATVLERDKPDPDAVLEAARDLRDAIRPYV